MLLRPRLMRHNLASLPPKQAQYTENMMLRLHERQQPVGVRGVLIQCRGVSDMHRQQTMRAQARAVMRAVMCAHENAIDFLQEGVPDEQRRIPRAVFRSEKALC